MSTPVQRTFSSTVRSLSPTPILLTTNFLQGHENSVTTNNIPRAPRLRTYGKITMGPSDEVEEANDLRELVSNPMNGESRQSEKV